MSIAMTLMKECRIATGYTEKEIKMKMTQAEYEEFMNSGFTLKPLGHRQRGRKILLKGEFVGKIERWELGYRWRIFKSTKIPEQVGGIKPNIKEALDDFSWESDRLIFLMGG